MKLKICGNKYSDNIRQVAELRPEFMGFIFYEGSKRFVGEQFVMPAIAEEIKKVGVFVNAEEAYILDKVNGYRLDLVQLQGSETADFCERISRSVAVIKAFGIDEQFDFKSLDAYKKHCAYFLFDVRTDVYEGAGMPIDLRMLEQYNNEVPFFIGGGMDLGKYRALSALSVKPYGINVNTKAEIKPGYKDIIKIIQIRNNVR